MSGIMQMYLKGAKKSKRAPGDDEGHLAESRNCFEHNAINGGGQSAKVSIESHACSTCGREEQIDINNVKG